MNKVIRSLATAAGAASLLVSFGIATATPAAAAAERAARVVCNSPGTGNTTVWGNCKNTGNATGEARLVYWCVNMTGSGSKQHNTGWKKVAPGKTVKFVGECTFKARNPYFQTR